MLKEAEKRVVEGQDVAPESVDEFDRLVLFIYRPGQPKIDSHSTMGVYFRLPRSVYTQSRT